jgi:hypothetical protein
MSASSERAAFTEKRSDKEPNRGACGKHPEDGFSNTAEGSAQGP